MQEWRFVPLQPRPLPPLPMSKDEADVMLACCVSQYEQQQQQQQHLTKQLQHACLHGVEVACIALLALGADALSPFVGGAGGAAAEGGSSGGLSASCALLHAVARGFDR
jgi:hypothetical protein